MNWPTKSAPPCVAYNGRHRHAHPPPRPRGGMTEQSGTATIVGSAVKDPASRSPAGIGDRQGRSVTGWPQQPRTGRMRSKESAMSVYRVTEIIGTSNTSWEDAAAEAIRTAAGTLRDLRVGEVVKQDIHLDEGGAITYRTKLQLSFKYENRAPVLLLPGRRAGAAALRTSRAPPCPGCPCPHREQPGTPP